INACDTGILVGREGTPDLGYGLVRISRRQKDPILEKIQIRRKAQAMKAIYYALTKLRILIRRYLWPPEFSDGDSITSRDGLIDELRYEAGKDLLLPQKGDRH